MWGLRMNFFCRTVVVFTFIRSSKHTILLTHLISTPLKSFMHKYLKPWIPLVKDRHTYSWQCTLYKYTLICTIQTSHTHFILSFKKAVKKHPPESVTACTETACWVCLALPFRLSHAEAQTLSPGFIIGCQHPSFTHVRIPFQGKTH